MKDIIKRNFPVISDEYKEFVLKKDKCQACYLYDCYKQIVQSEGNAKNPTFMFIGEAPGKDEVEQVRPFVGLAGQRLRSELRKYQDFRKDTVLISNILPCRPLDNKFPSSDKSLLVVKRCVAKWLIPEIVMLRPKVIVTLGNPALKHIVGDSGVTAHRGNWKFIHLFRYSVWVLSTFHPSYVIRCARSGDNHVVQQFEDDIAKVANTWQSIVSKDFRLSMNTQYIFNK